MEIMFDRGADYNKTSAAVARRREARELFQGEFFRVEGGEDHGMEQLLREWNDINNSMKSAAGC